jgi:hypothetical protein
VIALKKATAAEEAAANRLEERARAVQALVVKTAEEAQIEVQRACELAVTELNRASQSAQDRRKINGSYNWDRPDHPSNNDRGRSDHRIGSLEVGQAKREEQIIGLIDDCNNTKIAVTQLRTDFDTMLKELSARITTMRELTVEIKDAASKEVEALRIETQNNKIRSQQYVIGIVVGFIVTVILALLFGYFNI